MIFEHSIDPVKGSGESLNHRQVPAITIESQTGSQIKNHPLRYERLRARVGYIIAQEEHNYEHGTCASQGHYTRQATGVSLTLHAVKVSAAPFRFRLSGKELYQHATCK